MFSKREPGVPRKRVEHITLQEWIDVLVACEDDELAAVRLLLWESGSMAKPRGEAVVDAARPEIQPRVVQGFVPAGTGMLVGVGFDR